MELSSDSVGTDDMDSPVPERTLGSAAINAWYTEKKSLQRPSSAILIFFSFRAIVVVAEVDSTTLKEIGGWSTSSWEWSTRSIIN